jgi:hypothetical protein
MKVELMLGVTNALREWMAIVIDFPLILLKLGLYIIFLIINLNSAN